MANIKTVADLISELQKFTPETPVQSVQFGPDDSFIESNISLFAYNQKLVITPLNESEQSEYKDWIKNGSPEPVY